MTVVVNHISIMSTWTYSRKTIELRAMIDQPTLARNQTIHGSKLSADFADPLRRQGGPTGLLPATSNIRRKPVNCTRCGWYSATPRSWFMKAYSSVTWRTVSMSADNTSKVTAVHCKHDVDRPVAYIYSQNCHLRRMVSSVCTAIVLMSSRS